MAHANIHIEQKGQGKPIVLLHGWGVNSHIFTPLNDALADYSAHFVDLPGFGDSQAIAGELDDWVDAIADQISEPAIWIGWSLGGLVATRAAMRHPEKVLGLVTVTSSPHFVAQSHPTESTTPDWPGINPKVLTQFFDQLGQNAQRTIERFLAIQAMGSSSAKQDIKQIKQLLLEKPQPDTAALHLGLTLLQQVDLRGQIDALTLPWLRIWGRKDTLVPAALAEILPKHPHTQDVVFEHASHAPFISHSQAFNLCLLNWLETQQASR